MLSQNMETKALIPIEIHLGGNRCFTNQIQF